MADASIDFEFRSGADIALGLPAYFADPEAEPLCMAWDMGDGNAGLWTPGRGSFGFMEPLLAHVRAGGKVRGWNVMFEWHVWNLIMVPRFGWPPLTVEQCVDSMAEAAAMNLPQGLGNCARALDLPIEQQKDKRGKQLIRLLCIPQPEPKVLDRDHYASEGAYKGAQTRHRTWLDKGGRWPVDAAALQELYDYCVQDVVTEMAVVRKLRRLSEVEQRVWVLTQEINLRGVPISVPDIQGVTSIVEMEMERLNTELHLLTDGEVGQASEVGQLRDWCNARLSPDEQLPDMQAETIDALLLQADAKGATAGGRQVIRALQIRAAIGQTSTAKLPKMLEVVASDGTLKNMHVYHGASTGRDASRGGVNLQNLKRPSLDDIDTAIDVLSTGDYELASFLYGDGLMDAAVSVVRSVIKAPPGYEFTDGDFSSVENRVSAWIAGQEDKLQLFRTGLDEYKTYAVSAFGVPYEAVTKAQRTFAKPPVLGGMFGQGPAGLVLYAAGMGVTLSLDKAKELNGLYREQYAKVASMWGECRAKSIRACEEPDTWHPIGVHLAIAKTQGFLWLKLPSGRKIAWAAPKVEVLETPWGAHQPIVTVSQVDQFTHQWTRGKLIGSSIFQSAVQATARDLLMAAMFSVEEAGYRVVLRVHDELLSCNPVGFGSPDDFGTRMCRNPAWCPDLPLAYEAWRGIRFRK